MNEFKSFAFARIGILFYLAFPVLGQSFCDESSKFNREGNFIYAQFEECLLHFLNVSVVEEAFVQTTKQCLQRCLENPQCFSTNIAIWRRPDGKILCELLSREKFGAHELFQVNNSFHHYSILVSPAKNQCKLEFLQLKIFESKS